MVRSNNPRESKEAIIDDPTLQRSLELETSTTIEADVGGRSITIERPHERFEGVPALYFELAPNYFSYGCGYWDAFPATMAKLRRRIETDPKKLEKLVRKLNKSRFTLSGEQFKRPKGDVGKLLNPWYNAKNIAVGYDDNPEGVLFTPELKDEVLAGFRELMGLYLYLDSLAGDPEPNKE